KENRYAIALAGHRAAILFNYSLSATNMKLDTIRNIVCLQFKSVIQKVTDFCYIYPKGKTAF
ncbi:hypothetical protein, partial [Faecalimonas umbilicata]|uniref:hypothetical protein n=1 Tax=Faecalimonas umbilicata TaxID=1912855 RepID=UPI0022E14641